MPTLCSGNSVSHIWRDDVSSCWQLGGSWIAWSRWGSLGGGGRMVAAGASLSHLALRLPGGAQQLGFVPLTLSAGPETLQEKIHSVLWGKLV